MSKATRQVSTCLFALLIVSTNSCTAPAEALQLKIDSGWVMKTGDDPAWAKPDFDHKDWKPIETGKSWEQARSIQYDGYAWYRTAVTIPARWRKSSALKEVDADFFILSLGYIDDADETYFNGRKIGASGTMPPKYLPAYDKARRYRVPVDIIRFDKPNVIAIRVYDGTGPGGMYNGSPRLTSPTLEDIISVDYELGDGNGIFAASEPFQITLRLSNHSHKKLNASLECILKTDLVFNETPLDTKKHTIHIDASSQQLKTVRFDRPGPGFYRVSCQLSTNKSRSAAESMLFGYAPEKIDTPLTKPEDFDEFWKERRQELENVKPEYQVTHSDRSTDELDIYLVEMRSYGNVRIRGWYSVPRKPGPHPAILSVPGYNSTMWPYTYRKNVATFALNPRGHGNSKDDIDPKGAEYMFIGFDLEHPEEYIYAGAYMDCVRAVDFLASRPEIDSSRIGVEGGSQGGGLSLATAALDQRIAFCATDIPWLGDWVGYLAAEYWGHKNYPKLVERIPGLTFDDINHLLSYFDTMNLADRIKCPVLMSVGLQDPVCPPRTAFGPYNHITSPKEYRVYPFAGHGVGRQHNDLKNKWMTQALDLGQGEL